MLQDATYGQMSDMVLNEILTLQKPEAILFYNKIMGAIDTLDK